MIALIVTPSAAPLPGVMCFDYKPRYDAYLVQASIPGIRIYYRAEGMAAKLNDSRRYAYISDAIKAAEQAASARRADLAGFMEAFKEALSIVPGLKIESYHIEVTPSAVSHTRIWRSDPAFPLSSGLFH